MDGVGDVPGGGGDPGSTDNTLVSGPHLITVGFRKKHHRTETLHWTLLQGCSRADGRFDIVVN